MEEKRKKTRVTAQKKKILTVETKNRIINEVESSVNRKVKQKNSTKFKFSIRRFVDSIKTIFVNIKNAGIKIKSIFIKNRKSIIIIGAFLVTILLIIWTNNIYLIIKYKPYTDKIKSWGMGELYSNSKAAAYQKVTNLDMIKLVVGVSLNSNDITGISDEKESNFKGENWVKTTEIYNITYAGDISKKNYKKTAKLGSSALIMAKTKEKMINQPLSKVVVNLDSKAVKDVKEADKVYIKEAVTLGLLNNEDLNLNENLNKGEIAKLIVKYVEKTSAVHYDKNAVIETDVKKLPKTYKQYPYIIKGIENKVYDMPLVGKEIENFNTPITVYKTRKQIYAQTADRITKFYNAILNVDYTTINAEELRGKVEEYSLYYNNPELYRIYVDYVKKHKIKVQGNVEVYLPIIYYDGTDYRVRTKITFKILSSDTKENLLLLEFINYAATEYLDKNYTLYADVRLSQSYNSISQRIEVFPLSYILAEKTNRIIQK